MAARTREQHIRWCKERAYREWEHYKNGDLAEALENVVASMLSDLGKHPETRASQETAFMLMGTVKDEVSMRRFVDGFN